MFDYCKANINLEIEIPDSYLNKLYGRGIFFLMDNHKLILAYNQENEDNFHEKGKLVSIKLGNKKDLFETNNYIWAPILDADNIYLVTSSVIHGETSDSGMIFKFNSHNTLDWQYQLEGESNSLPVIFQDSIYLTDFIRSTRSGNIYRFNKEGNLIFKKPIRAFNTFEPWILKEKKHIIISFNKPKILEVLDFNGNSVNIKEVSDLGNVLFSQNTKGELFASINRGIAATDQNLNILWEYRPLIGFTLMAPVFDTEGNLYTLLNGRRLVALDPKGREKWITDIFGHGYQPCVLNGDNIMTVTSKPSGKRAKYEQFTTHIEIFSKLGKKLADYELPGYIFHTAKGDKGTIFIATNCIRINVKRESAVHSIKVFSLNFL